MFFDVKNMKFTENHAKNMKFTENHEKVLKIIKLSCFVDIPISV
jgi:predicted nucleic-acid-binding Zn-ribbon protein